MKAFQTPDGIRFEDDTYSPAEGEAELPALPSWNAATEHIEWDGAAWQKIPLNAIQLAAKAAELAAKAQEKRKRWPSRYALVEAFTDAEAAAIQKSTDATTNKLWALVLARDGAIYKDDPRITAGFNYLVARNLLTAERRDALLA